MKEKYSINEQTEFVKDIMETHNVKKFYEYQSEYSQLLKIKRT